VEAETDSHLKGGCGGGGEATGGRGEGQ